MLYRRIVTASLLLIIFIGGASFSRADLLEDIMVAKTILNVLRQEDQSHRERALQRVNELIEYARVIHTFHMPQTQFE